MLRNFLVVVGLSVIFVFLANMRGGFASASPTSGRRHHTRGRREAVINDTFSTSPLFGPKRYTRETGQPETVSDTFNNCGAAKHYQMVLTNGNPDGSNRISSARILVDGQQVIGPNDLNQRVAKVTKPVTLVDSNTLAVTLKSMPGSFVTLDVEAIGGCLSVSILSPSNGATVSQSPLFVEGTVQSGAPQVGVSVNGLPAEVENGQFAVANVPLQTGTNQITATATDSSGDRASASVQVTASAVGLSRVRAKADPDTIPTGGATTVTVTAQVDALSTLNPASINVIQLDALGQNVGVLGSLYDDGTHGDVLAHDGIYTGQFSISPSAGGFIYLEATAVYSDVPQPVASEELVISEVSMPTNAEIQTELQVQQQALSFFQNAAAQSGIGQARQATIAFLLQQAGVIGAGVSPDGEDIWIEYASGLRALIFGHAPGTQGSSASPSSDPVQITDTGRASVFAPFFSAFSPNDASPTVAADLTNVCGAGVVQPVKDSAVTVDLMKTLNQYGAIYVNTHGGVDGGGQVNIATGEPDSFLSELFHILDILTGRVEVVGTSSGNFLAVTSSFINHYAGGGFPHSIVFASACDTLGTDSSPNVSLANAFLNNGAAAYFGYRNSVFTDFNSQITSQLYGVLTNSSLSADQRTTGVAYSSLNNTIDPTANSDGTRGTLLLQGNNSAALSGNPVVNGDFETGDLSGWTPAFTEGGNPVFPFQGPDGPYVSAVTEQANTGSYSARVGRWDQPYMGGGALNGPPQPGAEPGGTDILYQDVQLPNSTPLHLTFAYNIVTFDAAIFDYFYVQLLDPATGNLLATVVPPTGPNPGPDYGFFTTTGWLTVSFDLTPFAGKQVRIWFGNHEDGFGDQTATYVDTVAISCQ